MSTEPCPHCKGRCCRDTDFGGRVEHMGAETYEHWCDYCQDGDRFIPPRTVEEERADVAAYLRDRMGCGQHAVAFVADHIERGEHVGWAKKSSETGR